MHLLLAAVAAAAARRRERCFYMMATTHADRATDEGGFSEKPYRELDASRQQNAITARAGIRLILPFCPPYTGVARCKPRYASSARRSKINFQRRSVAPTLYTSNRHAGFLRD